MPLQLKQNVSFNLTFLFHQNLSNSTSQKFAPNTNFHFFSALVILKLTKI